MHVNAVSNSLFASYCVIDANDYDNFGINLESFVQISLTSNNRRAAFNHDKLAKHWGISLDHAKDMVQFTTQCSVRTIANPALSRHFWTKDHMLRYRCLCHLVFNDTMFSNKYLYQSDECVQVCALDFGWVQLYPMKTKGEAHEALSLMFQH